MQISSSGSHFELSPKYHMIQHISIKDSQTHSVLLFYYCGRACLFLRNCGWLCCVHKCIKLIYLDNCSTITSVPTKHRRSLLTVGQKQLWVSRWVSFPCCGSFLDSISMQTFDPGSPSVPPACPSTKVKLDEGCALGVYHSSLHSSSKFECLSQFL